MAGEPERIELARSGGFANIPVRAEVSADALDPQERAGLDALLSRAPAEEAQAGAPDRFQYDVTVIAATAATASSSASARSTSTLRALIDRLERDATPGGPE